MRSWNLGPHSYSPSQVFYGRRMKTDAPITAATLIMRTDLSAAESAGQKVSDSKLKSASERSTTRPDLISGQTVSVQNPTTKRWDKRGIIVEARDARNRTFQVQIDGTVWKRSKLFLRPVHIPLQDPALASRGAAGPSRLHCDLANFPPLTPPLPACRSARVQQRKERETGSINAVFVAAAKKRKKEDAAAPATARTAKIRHDQPVNLPDKAGAGSSSARGTAKEIQLP
jgi:hypothetical protein